jgi:hypothetical protein
MRKYPFTYNLGWSNSRETTFRSCKRKYYYQYYGKQATSNKDEILKLKNLKTIEEIRGTLAHDLIEKSLKKIQKNKLEVNQDKLNQYLCKKIELLDANKDFDVYYNNMEFNKKHLQNEVMTRFQSFLKSSFYSGLIEMKESHPDWHIETNRSGFGETRIEGKKAYCILDFMVVGEKDAQIFDWKTGSPKEFHRDQLLAYALTATSDGLISGGNVLLHAVYIQDDKVLAESFKPNKRDLNQKATDILNAIQEMEVFCQEPGNNIAKLIANFPLTSDESICERCKFKKLCGR